MKQRTANSTELLRQFAIARVHSVPVNESKQSQSKSYINKMV